MTDELVLSLQHVTAGYREGGVLGRKYFHEVLHDVSFDVHRGEILGLVGESGTGKSTLAKTILGMVRPEAGQVIHYTKLSGLAVRYWMQKENIPLENVLIVVDDLALPFGTLRLKGKGSDAGHNGLKHIAATLGTQNYARLRFGIGNDFPRGGQIDYSDTSLMKTGKQ